MSTGVDLQHLSLALRELHRALIERARRDFEREHRVVRNPLDMLQLLANDPYFAWLRQLSELIVAADTPPQPGAVPPAELAAAISAAVARRFTPPSAQEPADEFARHYWPYVGEDPEITVLHAQIRQQQLRGPAN